MSSASAIGPQGSSTPVPVTQERTINPVPIQETLKEIGASYPNISVKQLSALKAKLGTELKVVCVSWNLKDPNWGLTRFKQSHIPGAIFANIEEHFSTPKSERDDLAGRHPWPTEAQMSRAVGLLGIKPDDVVVFYDDPEGTPGAARGCSVLESFGFKNAFVLDGNLSAWQAEKFPVETGASAVTPILQYPVHLQTNRVIKIDDMVRLLPDSVFSEAEKKKWLAGREGDLKQLDSHHVVIVDARANERYTGKAESIDPRAGHIPSAINIPFSELYQDVKGSRCLRSKDELLRIFKDKGIKEDSEVIVYCGSGVTACELKRALDTVGIRCKVYGGSWSEYSKRRELPLAT